MKNELPSTCRKPTQDELDKQKRERDILLSLGIDIYMFDEGTWNPDVDKDRTMAMLLVKQGKEIPEELRDRLLKYKRDEEAEKKQGCFGWLSLSLCFCVYCGGTFFLWYGNFVCRKYHKA